MVEPLSAKVLLPKFGGSADVWNASLLFFQVTLLLGYAYAHFGGRRWQKSQPWVHGGLFVLALLLVPLSHLPAFNQTAHVAGPIGPAIGVIADLAVFCGLPFFLLSAGSSLIQLWYSRAHPEEGEPYFLYASSNAGSLLGLLIYPLLIEPLFGLHLQARIWQISFALDLALVGFLIVLQHRSATAEPLSNHDVAAPPEPASSEAESKPLAWRRRLFWVALTAVPSSLLLGVTTYLTTNIAPIPLLWVIPLALYLITFIIAFKRGRSWSSAQVARWVPLVVAPLAIAIILESTEPLIPLALFHLIAIFLISLSCHTRLAEDRPEPIHLTEFFLWVAVGGAIGGVFNVLVAPLIFKTLAEYPLAIALGCALILNRRGDWPRLQKWDWVWPVAIAVLILVIDRVTTGLGLPPSPVRTLLVIGLPALLCFLASDVPLRFGVCLGSLFLVSSLLQTSSDGHIIFSGRSFYGVHRVVDESDPPLRRLVHGNTIHGIESLDPAKESVPLTYYSEQGPIGDLFHVLNRTGFRAPVGLIGMGVGSLAAYGQPGQTMDYFEIDPVVIWLARDSGMFHFLADSKATMHVIEGDGRLSLSAEPNGKYGLLVFDAFTSDSIPVHLLTENAISMDLQKLQPHGIVAFHISNRYLDLAPVLAANARDLGLVIREEKDEEIDPDLVKQGVRPSDWVVMARQVDDLPRPVQVWSIPAPASRGWTDDYSNLITAFKWGQ